MSAPTRSISGVDGRADALMSPAETRSRTEPAERGRTRTRIAALSGVSIAAAAAMIVSEIDFNI